MRRLYSVARLTSILFGQNLSQAMNFDEEDNKSNSDKYNKQISADDDNLQGRIAKYENQSLDDEKANDLLEHFMNSKTLGSYWDYFWPKITILQLRDNLFTNSGTLSLSCILNYPNDLEEIDIRHNNIDAVIVEAFFVNIFMKKNYFKFCFTARQDIKSNIEKLAQRYNKSVVWREDKLLSEDVYDFEVLIKNHLVETYELKEEF